MWIEKKSHYNSRVSLHEAPTKKSVSNNCQLVQYADDTMIYSAHQDENQAIQNLEKNVKDLVHFFRMP